MGSLHQFRRFVGDSLTNLITGLGTSKDPRTSSTYSFEPLDRNQLDSAYRGDWICKKIVNAPAEDATREWREWQTDQPNIEKLENAEKMFDMQRKLKRALILARLFGGSAIVMGVAQGKAEEELDVEAVGEGDLKWLAIFHQFELTPGQRVLDVNSPWFDRPEYYQLGTDTTNVNDKTTLSAGVRIHPSRVIPLVGAEIPDIRQNAFGTWGDSVLQAVDEAVKATGTVIGGIASMVVDAKMDVISVPGLSAKLSNPEESTKLLNRYRLANQMKSINNTLLLDEKEVWARTQTSFASMPQLIQEFLTVAAGAAGIPVSRLLGMAKGKGLGGTEGGGEVDTRNYYDGISNMQRTELSPTLAPLDDVFIRSTLGTADDSIYYEWTPLWQLSDTEKSAIALQKAKATQADVTMALINEDALRDARVNQLIEDGTYPGLQDAIDEHGAEPPDPTPEEQAAQLTMMGKTLPPQLGGPPPPKQIAGPAKPTNPTGQDNQGA